MLLRKKFGILGTSLGLINASVDEAADHFLMWQSEIGRMYGYSLSSEVISEDVESALSRLFPLTAPLCKKYLFLPTTTNWTAFFDNAILGTDAVGAMSVLAKKLNTMAIRVTCSPHTMPPHVTKSTKGSYGANILEVYNEHADVVRSIYCANDGGKWKFGQSGNPFEFEDVKQYLVRRISDRFTEEMLHRYLSCLAVDGLDNASYRTDGSPGIFIQKIGNVPSGVEVGLDEVMERINAGKVQ